jgi:hypothetical protein
MNKIDALARDAGFRKSGEAMTCSTLGKGGELAGIDIIVEPLMPEGWLGMRTDKGVMCMGPDGKSFWVPAFDLDDLLKKPFAPREQSNE